MENHEEALDAILGKLQARKSPIDEKGFWSPEGGADWPWPVLLKRLRLMRGLSQRQLAEKAGIVQSHVAKAEAGADIRMSTLERLIGAMGCRSTIRVRPFEPFELR